MILSPDIAIELRRTWSLVAADTGASATTLRDLGGRHLGYGVRVEHYDDVGRALIATLEQALGEAFAPAARAAWTAAYGAIATLVIEGTALAALAPVEA